MLWNVIKALRFFRAQLIGPPVGQWSASGGEAWRLRPDGTYEYREMTQTELDNWDDNAW